MFCLSHSLPFRRFIQSSSLLIAKSFSTVTSVDTLLRNGNLQAFIQSIVSKPDSNGKCVEKFDSSFESFQQQLVSSGLINEADTKECSQVISSFSTLLKEDSDPKTILTQIKEDPFLASFLNASKRSVSIADYCAYFLLYPLFASIPSPQDLESLSAYVMRMQSQKILRANPLAPPLLQLKPKKAKTAQNAQSSIPLTPEECFGKLDIRVGRVMKAWNHPESEKLICEQVDVGEETLRSIASGICAFHSAEEMEGRLVCVMCNMKQKKLAGYPSNGMLLCASTPDHSRGALIDPPESSIVGERISCGTIQDDPATPNQVAKKKMVETALQYLKTNEEGICCFKDIPLSTTKGPITCKGFPNQTIS